MSEIIDINENLIGEKIEENDNPPTQIPNATFQGSKSEEKQLLKDMGFDEEIINTIYNNMNPIDLQEAIDYLNKNERGQFTHSFLVNENNVCTICGKGRNAHESDTLFVENENNEQNNDDDVDIFDSLLDIIGRRNNNSSNRFNAYEKTYKNTRNSSGGKNGFLEKECGICADKIESPNKVFLKCGHYFCVDCWTDYLTEKISNANVAKILCMQHGCGTILESDFIKKILEGNKDLIEKYDKFLQRKKMLEQSDKFKFCPFPDCEGYAEKKGKDKYVKCNFGHEFCFECGNPPHGKKKCEDMLDKEFEKWRSQKIVKRCPCCRMWTEKNEGCNHMTCVECRFQWCWLCQKPYNYNHFYEGACNGLQFYKETDEKKIKAKLEENRKRYPGPSRVCTFFVNTLKWIGYIFLFYYLHLFEKYGRDLEDMGTTILIFTILAFYPIFVCFEILFVFCVIVVTIPILLYPPYFRRLKFYVHHRLYQC